MKIAILCGLYLALVFVEPVFILLGWNAARELWPTLPEATYWQAFWIGNAISIMFKTSISNKKD